MFPSVSEFKEKMLNGGTRPSMFRMEITWPIAIALGNAQAAPLLPFMCHMSELPGSAVGEITVKYAGRDVHFAGQRKYDKLSIDVYNDGEFRIRRALEAWHDAINSRETNIAALTSPTGDSSTGYAGTGRVVQQDLKGNEVRSYVFIDMFPTRIGPMQLDWGSDNQLSSFRVEFNYEYWVPGDEYVGSVVRSVV